MQLSSSVRQGLLLAASFMSGEALAQDRSDDNAITQAEDAFGFSVGRESIGIYSAGNARGFSPTAAGNVRIDGLYFDPIFGLQGLLVDSVSIKVGLSAQGYPFAAPSGIVDQTLKRPEDDAGASILVNGDSWGGAGIELDGSLPIAASADVRAGFNIGRQVFPNGTDNFNHTESIAVHWRPAHRVEIVPFWARYDDYNDEAGTFYIPDGSFIATIDKPLHEESPIWSDIRFSGQNMGVLTSVGIGRNTVARLGAFRSSVNNRSIFSHFLTDLQPDGTAERILIADPPSHNRSLSGEARLSHSLTEGPRLHVVHVSARRKDARREFGGSDQVSFGIGRVGERVTEPMPEFEFGPQTRQHVQQTTFGVAYIGRWKDVGEIGFGLSRADYEKVTDIPGFGEVVAKSRPWLYNGTAAVTLSNSVSLYAGYARGFEESGTAPLSAANRNEPLETILTEQKDAGVRVAVTKDITAVAGVFDLERPYFGFDEQNVFRQVGSVRSRGAEFSVSGKVTPTVNILIGGVLLKPRVEAGADVQGNIGRRPFGLPTHIINFNGNWQTPVKGLQLDLGLSHRGRQPATTDNLVMMPTRFNVNAGMRQGFQLMGNAATFRLQMVNVLNNTTPSTAAPGVYGPGGARQVVGFVTVDF